MRARWLAVLVVIGCAPSIPGTASHSGSAAIRPAQGPFASRRPLGTAEAAEIWLDADRDVILLGQLPRVNLVAGEKGVGRFNSTRDFTLLEPNGSPVVASCDASRQPDSSAGFVGLSFECHPMIRAGVYVIQVDPRRVGLAGSRVVLPIRVLDAAPPMTPPPVGWSALSLLEDLSKTSCYQYGESFAVTIDAGKPVLRAVGRPAPARLPVDLAKRVSSDHAEKIRYVFETDDGWLVLFDHGEFGGGIEWFDRRGGDPRSIVVGEAYPGDYVPQNVNRAMASDGALFVLQGITHGVSSGGQLVKVWREHDHFTSHVIARYSSEPVDWIREPGGIWLVVTWDAVWRTSDAGTSTLVAGLPDVLDYPNSLARSADGTFYIGMRGGIVRLTPTWPDAPRYAADFPSRRLRAVQTANSNLTASVLPPAD